MVSCILIATITAYYVSPTGSDTGPGTCWQPFATLEAAQKAMQDGSTRTTFVRAGTYLRSTPLILTNSDNGETWATCPCDPPRSAIVDGGNSTTYAFSIIGGSNITITNFRIQNVLFGGVLIHGGASVSRIPSFNANTNSAINNVISNNDIGPITGDYDIESVNGGGVSAEGAVTGTAIMNNYIHDATYMGIGLRTQHNPSATPPDDISNSIIIGNVLLNTDTIESDAGAIYLHDWLATSTNIRIEHNFIRDWQSPAGTSDHCIYLDAAASNVSISGNVCGPPGTGAANQSSIIMLCGNHNKIEGNIIDLGSTGNDTLVGIGTCRPPAVLTDMTGNTFKRNVVISNFAGRQNSTWSGQSNQSFPTAGPPPNYPAIDGNIYHNYGGGQEITTGNVVSDSNPVRADPFCHGWTYSLAANSPAFSNPVNFPLIAENWGPQGFVIPHAGASPSCPH